MGGMMYQGPPQTFPTNPASSNSSNLGESVSLLSWSRPPPQGSSPSRLMGPRVYSGPGYPASMMGSVSQMPATISPHLAMSGQSIGSYNSPSRPHPSVFFAVSLPSFCLRLLV